MGKLLNGETVRNDMRYALYWPNIGDGAYSSTTRATFIRDPRIRLAHMCITYSFS